MLFYNKFYPQLSSNQREFMSHEVINYCQTSILSYFSKLFARDIYHNIELSPSTCVLILIIMCNLMISTTIFQMLLIKWIIWYCPKKLLLLVYLNIQSIQSYLQVGIIIITNPNISAIKQSFCPNNLKIFCAKDDCKNLQCYLISLEKWCSTNKLILNISILWLCPMAGEHRQRYRYSFRSNI